MTKTLKIDFRNEREEEIVMSFLESKGIIVEELSTTTSKKIKEIHFEHTDYCKNKQILTITTKNISLKNNHANFSLSNIMSHDHSVNDFTFDLNDAIVKMQEVDEDNDWMIEDNIRVLLKKYTTGSWSFKRIVRS